MLVLAVGDCFLDGGSKAGSMGEKIKQCLEASPEMACCTDYNTSCCFRGEMSVPVLLNLQNKEQDLLVLCEQYSVVQVLICCGTNDASKNKADGVFATVKSIVSVAQHLVKGGGWVRLWGVVQGLDAEGSIPSADTVVRDSFAHALNSRLASVEEVQWEGNHPLCSLDKGSHLDERGDWALARSIVFGAARQMGPYLTAAPQSTHVAGVAATAGSSMQVSDAVVAGQTALAVVAVGATDAAAATLNPEVATTNEAVVEPDKEQNSTALVVLPPQKAAIADHNSPTLTSPATGTATESGKCGAQQGQPAQSDASTLPASSQHLAGMGSVHAVNRGLFAAEDGEANRFSDDQVGGTKSDNPFKLACDRWSAIAIANNLELLWRAVLAENMQYVHKPFQVEHLFRLLVEWHLIHVADTVVIETNDLAGADLETEYPSPKFDMKDVNQRQMGSTSYWGGAWGAYPCASSQLCMLTSDSLQKGKGAEVGHMWPFVATRVDGANGTRGAPGMTASGGVVVEGNATLVLISSCAMKPDLVSSHLASRNAKPLCW